MDSVKKGRKLLIFIITTILLIDIITIAVTTSIIAVNGGMDYASFKLLQGIFRFLLTCLLLFFLYRGHSWAKWIISILLMISGVLSILSFFGVVNIFILLLGIIYTMISLVLIKSRDVNTFMKYQRGDLSFDSSHTDSEQI